VIAWVPFRAADFSASFTIWKAMFGAGEGGVWHPLAAFAAHLLKIDPIHGATTFLLPNPRETVLSILALFIIVLFAPNTQEIMGIVKRSWDATWLERILPAWAPTLAWAAAIGCLFGWAIGQIPGSGDFLYFRF
jgi:hypothetical protein